MQSHQRGTKKTAWKKKKRSDRGKIRSHWVQVGRGGCRRPLTMWERLKKRTKRRRTKQKRKRISMNKEKRWGSVETKRRKKI